MPRRAIAGKEPVEATPSIEHQVAALTKRVEALEASRPGRKAKPLIALRQDGVCAISPDIDSSTCEDASIFRYQQGCHGTACKAKQHNAYERRKGNKESEPEPEPVAKAKRAKPATKTAAKPTKAAAKKAAPGRRAQRLAAVG